MQADQLRRLGTYSFTPACLTLAGFDPQATDAVIANTADMLLPSEDPVHLPAQLHAYKLDDSCCDGTLEISCQCTKFHSVPMYQLAAPAGKQLQRLAWVILSLLWLPVVAFTIMNIEG